MVVFKRKNYTIPEGHYTGPKDIDEIPGAVETIAKGALGGAGIGALAGGIMKDTTMLEGALTGAKYGSLGGIVAKLFLNYIHKPMSSVKYQEVDKNIRRQFGVYRINGITVGDSVSKRANIDEKFSFNDRDVSSYKLNFAVHNNQVTMYTFGMTKEELDKTSKILDYYCKKYFSMEYTAKIINQKVNAYSVDITFTNYYTMCQFIMELSDVIGSKINLLDNNVIVTPRLQEKATTLDEPAVEEKDFSVSGISKYDLLKMIGEGISRISVGAMVGSICSGIHGALLSGLGKLGELEIQRAAKGGMGMGSYGNPFLEATLKKLHYVEGFHYTAGDKRGDVQMSLISGILMVSCTKDKSTDLDNGFWKPLKTKINRSDTGKVVVYTYALKSTREFDLVVNKLMSTGVTPNIFDKSMIVLRTNNFSDTMLNKVVEKLEKDGVVDYETADRIPTDVISVTTDLNSLKIYIPKDLEYSQYEIEDYIRTLAKFVRTSTGMERNIYVMKLTGTLTQAQYIKLIEWIIDSQGFCTILTSIK